MSMAEPSETVAAILASVDDKPAAYVGAARRLAALDARPGLEPVRIGVVSTYTFELVAPYLVVEAARRGFDASVRVAPYGQLEQPLVDPSSGFFGRPSPDLDLV